MGDLPHYIRIIAFGFTIITVVFHFNCSSVAFGFTSVVWLLCRIGEYLVHSFASIYRELYQGGEGMIQFNDDEISIP